MAQSSFAGFTQPKRDDGKGGYKGRSIPFSEAKEPPLFATYGTLPVNPSTSMGGGIDYKRNGVHDGTFIYCIASISGTYYLYKYNKYGAQIASANLGTAGQYSRIFYNSARNTILIYFEQGLTNATYPILEVNTSTLATTNISALFNYSPLNITTALMEFTNDGKGNLYVTQVTTGNAIYVTKLNPSDYSLITTASSTGFTPYTNSTGANVYYSTINDGLYYVGSGSGTFYVIPYSAATNSFGTAFTHNPTGQAITETNHAVDSEGRLILFFRNSSTGYRYIAYFNANNTLLQSYTNTGGSIQRNWIIVFKNNFLVVEQGINSPLDTFTTIITNVTGATTTNRNRLLTSFIGNSAPRENIINGLNITHSTKDSANNNITAYITTLIDQLSY